MWNPQGQWYLYPNHQADLERSGIIESTWRQAAIHSVWDGHLAASLLNWRGVPPVPALAFPNFDRRGQITHVVLKPDCPRVKADGKPIKYESPQGLAPRLYFPPPGLIPPQRWQDPSVPLLVVEGTKKALAAAQLGYATISVPGTTMCHDIAERHASGQRMLHPDLRDVIRPGRAVFIGFDGGDTTHNANVILAEAHFAHMLLDAGVSPKLLRIPFEHQETKVGLDDYLAVQDDRRAALCELLDAALDGDPLQRVRLLDSAADKARSALDLLNDLSFAAALRVADEATNAVVCNELRRVASIKKSAVEEKVRQFRERLAPVGAVEIISEAPDPEALARAEHLLYDPSLIQRFLADLECDGLIGEQSVALTLLLIAVSRRMAKPLHAVIKAASSSGKNFVVGRVASYVPPSDVLEVTDMSPRALQYMTSSIKNKLVIIAEQEGAERAEYPLRIAMSEGKLNVLVAEKNESGRIETREHVVEGPAAFVTTTTRARLHDENETRQIELTLDESPEQTARITKLIAHLAEHPPTAADEQAAALRRSTWRAALGMLELREVRVPQAPQLERSFPKDRIRARRDFSKLIGLIQAVTVLHQKQRPVVDEQLEATDYDVQVAQWLCQALWSVASPRLVDLAARLRKEFGDRSFTPREAANALGHSTDAARRQLVELGDAELAEQVSESKGSRAASWRMRGADCVDLPDREWSRGNLPESSGKTSLSDSPTGGHSGVEEPLPPNPHGQHSGWTVGEPPLVNKYGYINPIMPAVGQVPPYDASVAAMDEVTDDDVIEAMERDAEERARACLRAGSSQ